MRRFTLYALTICSFLGLSSTVKAQFSGGTGTSGDPYQIANLTDLQTLSENNSYWDSYFVQTTNIDATKTNTWNETNGFHHIGTDDTPFAGTYDGGGYTISNLFINRTGNSIGMFGKTDKAATIKNLGMADGDVSGGNYRVGGLVGYNNGTIYNCYYSGSVNGADKTIGGLVGVSTGTIEESYSSGTVTGTSRIGGLIGYVNSGGDVTNCYSTASVSGTTIIGGLIGWIEGENSDISYCYSVGKVTGSSDIGGFAGTSTGTVTDCYWDKTTSGVSSSAAGKKKNTAYMQSAETFSSWDGSVWYYQEEAYPQLRYWAVIDGYFSGGKGTATNPFIIANLEDLEELSRDNLSWGCYFEQTADIDASETKTWNSGKGFSPIGNSTIEFTGHYNGKGHTICGLFVKVSELYAGLFGYLKSGSIKNLGLVNGNVSNSKSHSFTASIAGYNYIGSISNCYNTGSVTGTYVVGGIVGRNYEGGSISNCYNSGNVSSSCSTRSNAGGIVGENVYSSIVNCFNVGKVSASGTEKKAYSGGISGAIYESSSIISNCYNTGSVSSSVYTSSDAYSGSITGYKDDGNISNCFYDSEHCTVTADGGTETISTEGIGLSFAQMKKDIYFFSWDFDTTWGIRNGSTYPQLRGMHNPPTINSDTVLIHGSASIDSLPAYDYANGKSGFEYVVSDTGECTISSNVITIPSSANPGDCFTIYYYAGKLVNNDTLWGFPDKAKAILKYIVSSAIVDTFYAETSEDLPLSIAMTGLVTNYDGFTLTSASILGTVQNSTAVFTNDSLVYTPTPNFYGENLLTYRITDGNYSDTGVVIITVTSVNDAPVARDTVITVQEGTQLSFELPASDIDGTIKMAAIEESPDNGTASASGTTLTYTPDDNFAGNDTIVWYALDNENAMSNSATIFITVSSSTDINETISETISVYPNPASKSFTVEGFSGTATICLYNTQGSRVLTETSVSSGESIDISTLPYSMYLLTIKTEQHTIQQKLVKE